MNLDGMVAKMKKIQNDLLEFLEDEPDAEDKYENFIDLLSTQRIINNRYEFKSLLQLINSIGDDHHRVRNFIFKIERLLRHFKNEIKQYFSNSEIFKIFSSNKRILLFLIEEKMMIIDDYIFSIITSYSYSMNNYCVYFQPEIKQFLTKENFEKCRKKRRFMIDDKFIERMNKEVEENFYDKRREGSNDDYLCSLIRNNEIKEFIKFTEQSNLSLEGEIKRSIYETNQFFADKNYITLIDYASFYGSIDIIKYMENKGVKLISSMWIYAIHSCNAELIRYLEENNVSPRDNDYVTILEESIKCHHNEISNYIIDNLVKEEDLQYDIEEDSEHNLNLTAVESRNYCFFPTNMKNQNMFFYLCQFDYPALVELYLKEENVDINATIKILII